MHEIPEERTLRFDHAEIQQVLYTSLSPLRRRILHHHAGEALTERFKTAPANVAERLAYHFYEAGELEQAIIYSNHAARQAQVAYANEIALMWYNKTLDMLKQLKPEEANTSQSLRLSIYKSLGKVLTLMGQYGKALEYYTLARAILTTERSLPAQTSHLADLCYQTARTYERRSEYNLALEWLEEGWAYLDESKESLELTRICYLSGGGSYAFGPITNKPTPY